VRAIDHFRLKQLKDERIDIMISHDWPCGITDFGNVNALLNIKPFLRDDINNRRLGNPAAMSLLVNVSDCYLAMSKMYLN
jgi:lariat debranching enzyme